MSLAGDAQASIQSLPVNSLNPDCNQLDFNLFADQALTTDFAGNALLIGSESPGFNPGDPMSIDTASSTSLTIYAGAVHKGTATPKVAKKIII